ncbi:MAG: hypothetical protein ACYC09_12630 [Bacteroidota bacterium]
MKSISLFFAASMAIVPIVLHAQMNFDDPAERIIISDRVGITIDKNEREHFQIFLNAKGFLQAEFFKNNEEKFFTVVTRDENGSIVQDTVSYPSASLYRLAEKIDHFEDIKSMRYYSGEEPVLIRTEAGSSITLEIGQRVVVSKTSPAENRQSAEIQTDFQDEADESVEFDPMNDREKQGVRVAIAAGYAFSLGGQTLSNYTRRFFTENTRTMVEYLDVKDEYFTTGEGYRIGLNVSLPVHSVISMYCDVSYSSGSKQQKDILQYQFSSNPAFYEEYVTSNHFRFRHVPISFGAEIDIPLGIVSSFGGIGITTNLLSDLEVDNIYTTASGFKRERKVEYQFDVPVGFVGFFGISAAITSRMSVFTQVKVTSLTQYMTQEEITRYFENGVDKLNSLPTSERILKFEKNKSFTQPYSAPSNQPRFGGPPVPVLMNSVAVLAGFTFK